MGDLLKNNDCVCQKGRIAIYIYNTYNEITRFPIMSALVHINFVNHAHVKCVYAQCKFILMYCMCTVFMYNVASSEIDLVLSQARNLPISQSN